MRKILSLLILMPSMGLADDVHLKGGAVISGRIVEQTEAMISVDIGDGVVGFPMARVERIEKKRSALDEYDARAARLRVDDAAGWRSLGGWASHEGLPAQSSRAYEHVLTIAPGDAEARQALGYVLVDGRWLTEEEGYRAAGYVKHDGEWMTPAEAQASQAATAAEEGRRQAELRAADAEQAAREAEERAREAEQRAHEAESQATSPPPVYWGGWGYGVAVFPSTGPNTPLPGYRPPTPPPQVKTPDRIRP
jgi:hypothetical protein